MARLTQIDFDREMAFIAVDDMAEDATQTVGVVRTITDPNNDCYEFAISSGRTSTVRGWARSCCGR